MGKQVITEKPGKPKETAPETTLGKNKLGEKVQDETSQAKPEVKAKVGRIPFFKLFKYSSCGQKLLVAIGIISAIISGAAAPTISIIFGEIVAIFDPRNEPQVIEDGIIKLFKLIAVLCSILWVFGYLQYACLQAAAERLSFDLRSLYLSALLKQETEYFEKKQVESMPSQIAEFFQAIGEGVGEKVGQLVYTIAMFIGGLAIAFWYGPIFTLICLAYTPLMVGAIAIFGGLVSKKMKDKLEQTKKLGAHTEETLSALKLVVSFAQEDLALSQYDKIASESNQIAKTAGMFQSLVHGVFLALMFGFFVFCYATGKWLIQDGVINPASGKIYTVVEIIQVSQASMMAMMTFAQVFPIVPAIIKALVVGKEVFDVIERVPLIRSPDVPSESSNKICIDEGIIFENVSFRYPTAPVNSRDVFSKVSFTIRPYTSTAIVGPSGSGKSTIVQLLNRFYDPSEVSSAQGTIYLGKDDLKSKDLTALRGMIGYVSQEPVLILGTIRDNLLFCNKDATEEDMEQTLKKADAGFVFELEKGLDTYVGSGSVLNLSGGQKQRIAIARALIKKPKILVLDEATSALDPKSEAEVQAAISKIQKEEGDHITVIMIAHRLQTIETAQNLLYLDEPYRVLAGEKGTAEYEEIMERLRKTNYAHQQEEEQKGENAENKETNKKLKTQMTLKSQPSLKDDDKEKEVEELSSVEKVDERRQSRKGNGWCRIFTYYQPKIFAFFMMVTAGINALSFPTLGYLVAKIQMILMGNDYLTDWREQVSLYLWLFLGLCILIGLATGIEKAMFTTTGENLTFNVRRDLIRGILFKQVSWFDREDRAPGILTNVLSEDVSALNGMTTETISVLAEAFLSLTLGMLISLIISWKMALCTVAVSPVMLVGVIAMSRLQWGNKRGKSKADQDASGIDEYEKSNALLSDVILNYRTVIGFGQKNVNVVVNRFQKLLEEPSRKKVKNAHIGGFFFGYSNCARMLFLGIVFLIGSELVRKYSDQSDDIYMSIWILFSTCMGAGIAMSNVPSVQKAKNSASNIFAIIDESSTLDVRESSGEGIKTISEGKIEFKDVNFSYPTRKAFVLNKFNMKIPSTQKIALVGHSGCGKSTITNLLLRFYNIQEGTIEIDGINLVDYDVKALRRQIGYVMQEPVLFNQSIRQNILYGELNASDEQILKVAEMANALTFIESNVEDLDKEQRKVKTAMDLVEEIKKISQSKPKFGLLASVDLNELQTNLLLNVLKKADPIAINLIEEAPAAFMKQLQEDSKVPGMKWDDLVLNFEWTFEFKKILASDKLDKETKQIVEQTGQSLKYWFNFAMVQAWAANRAESLFEYVQSNQQIFLEARQERIKKLQASMIDKLRDPVTGKIKLSEGFDKNCGLKGQKLSGGQKQRIAIARALIKDPKILILDEATSALDEQSQEIVQQALDRAMEGRTSIVIAHRLSTIRNCNLLFVLNNGKIVETGTYDELSNNDQSYFYKLKSGMEM